MEFTKEEMHKYNNYQWDENYPKSGDFEKDILNGTLYIWEDNKRVAVSKNFRKRLCFKELLISYNIEYNSKFSIINKAKISQLASSNKEIS